MDPRSVVLPAKTVPVGSLTGYLRTNNAAPEWRVTPHAHLREPADGARDSSVAAAQISPAAPGPTLAGRSRVASSVSMASWAATRASGIPTWSMTTTRSNRPKPPRRATTSPRTVGADRMLAPGCTTSGHCHQAASPTCSPSPPAAGTPSTPTPTQSSAPTTPEPWSEASTVGSS